MYTRALSPDILAAAQYFPVVALLGPRQSGKTTLAQNLFPHHRYLSLEDLDLREAAHRDPKTFLQANSNPQGIIIDEFQHVPTLLSYLQTIVDRDPKPGYFVLTGSQNFLMNQAISQSLAGRISLHTLLPLSIAELKANKILPDEIEPMLFQGCYPAIFAKQIPPERLYKNYLQTYIERDVRQLANIGDLTKFQTFIRLCAARVGQLINFTSLGNEAGVSDVSVRRWLTILEASYIVFRLAPFHQNFGKRLIKSSKLYFYDTGLLCSLLQIRSTDLATHQNRGNIFESFIIADILKFYFNQGKTPRIYFWRDKSEHEIDCLIEDGQSILPIEIKSGRTYSPRFFEGINFWHSLRASKSQDGLVVYAGSSSLVRSHPHLLSWQDLELTLIANRVVS